MNYHSGLLLMGTIYRLPFIYMWRHLKAATEVTILPSGSVYFVT